MPVLFVGSVAANSRDFMRLGCVGHAVDTCGPGCPSGQIAYCTGERRCWQQSGEYLNRARSPERRARRRTPLGAAGLRPHDSASIATFSTSSSVVSPSMTLAIPLTRRVCIPSAIASSRTLGPELPLQHEVLDLARDREQLVYGQPAPESALRTLIAPASRGRTSRCPHWASLAGSVRPPPGSGSYASLQFVQILRTSRCAMTRFSDVQMR